MKASPSTHRESSAAKKIQRFVRKRQMTSKFRRSENNLDRVISKIQKKLSGHSDYVFIDDDVFIGTLTPHMMEKSQTSEWQPTSFIPDNNKFVFYLTHHDNIIGYISGKYNYLIDDDDTDYVHLSYVEINKSSRGKGLCKLMIQLCTLIINNEKGTKCSFHLENAGNKISCKCYFDAFNECGYSGYYYTEDIETKKRMNKNTCITIYDKNDEDEDEDEDNDIYLVFIPKSSDSTGGKRIKNK